MAHSRPAGVERSTMVCSFRLTPKSWGLAIGIDESDPGVERFLAGLRLEAEEGANSPTIGTRA